MTPTEERQVLAVLGDGAPPAAVASPAGPPQLLVCKVGAHSVEDLAALLISLAARLRRGGLTKGLDRTSSGYVEYAYAPVPAATRDLYFRVLNSELRRAKNDEASGE